MGQYYNRPLAMSKGLALSTIGALLQRPNTHSIERALVAPEIRTGQRPELAVGAQSYKVEMVGIRLAIDQDEIGPNVAVAMVLPRPGQRVIVMTSQQGPIGCQIGYNVLDLKVEGSWRSGLSSRVCSLV